ncbi:HNH endonuclease [Mesorhizobium loti]|nr:hypothetical protein [Mesorhizobium japonicum]PBB13280.1 HNH endonuclease [Mesorhizobium loti]QGX77964.1 HNH endonuclease [Mesorhizobium japonicum R7A]MUT29603.1 hypothetical protein [Mesorhizobium japonicum]PBB49704.1 HNH endonuclease [Mesorhizobium loti]
MIPFVWGICMPTLRNPQYRAFVRRKLYMRQDGKCFYCHRDLTTKKTGELALTIEHRKAKMKGGTDDLKNLVAACWHCNHHRGEQMNATKQRKEAKALSRQRRMLARDCRSKADSQADGKAHEQLAGKVEGNGANRTPSVHTARSEGLG